LFILELDIKIWPVYESGPYQRFPLVDIVHQIGVALIFQISTRTQHGLEFISLFI